MSTATERRASRLAQRTDLEGQRQHAQQALTAADQAFARDVEDGLPPTKSAQARRTAQQALDDLDAALDVVGGHIAAAEAEIAAQARQDEHEQRHREYVAAVKAAQGAADKTAPNLDRAIDLATRAAQLVLDTVRQLDEAILAETNARNMAQHAAGAIGDTTTYPVVDRTEQAFRALPTDNHRRLVGTARRPGRDPLAMIHTELGNRVADHEAGRQ